MATVISYQVIEEFSNKCNDPMIEAFKRSYPIEIAQGLSNQITSYFRDHKVQIIYNIF